MAGKWAEQQLSLLQLERDEEAAQLREKLQLLSGSQCQEQGLALLQLSVDSSCTSLYGRVTLCLARRERAALPTHQMKVGDEVELFDPVHLAQDKQSGDSGGRKKSSSSKSSSDSSVVSGVVCKVTSSTIEMVCDDSKSEEESSAWLYSSTSLRLNLRSSEATYKKLTVALENLRSVAGHGSKAPKGVCCLDSTAVMLNMIFHNDAKESSDLTEASAGGRNTDTDCPPFNSSLNESQIEAINFALYGPSKISLIHGPPGTGKTTAVTELILQALVRGKKVLVCAPSNVAVDNILERLVSPNTSSTGARKVNVQAVRIGHPARMSPNVLKHCLDALVLRHEGTEIVQDVRTDIDNARKKLSKANGRKDRTERRELQSEIRELRREARKREDVVVNEIMNSRNVVLATCVGASSHLIKDTAFDLIVVDEAAQGLEASCWIPLMHCNGEGKVVLAGDHCQLPPTIKSDEAARKGLAVTLFERIIRHSTLKHCAKLLDTQYRMNEQISDWASKEMYEGCLLAHRSNALHTLQDLTTVAFASQDIVGQGDKLENDDLASTVMMLVDTAGCNMDEDTCDSGDLGGSAQTSQSHRNVHEAAIVHKHVHKLFALGLTPDQIGVITPYNGQLECLRDRLLGNKGDIDFEEDVKAANDKPKKLEIRTVDGFQGGEKEAIIISLVRSNSKREVGFLAEKRRINVAVTRAKRHLMVVCDSDTVSSDPFIKRLLDHISEHGEHRSAIEYMDLHLEEASQATPELVSTLTSLGTITSNDMLKSGQTRTSDSNFAKASENSTKTKILSGHGKKSSQNKKKGSAGATVLTRNELFRQNITELLSLVACDSTSFRGGSFGKMAIQRLYNNLSNQNRSCADIFKELLTPHSTSTRQNICEAIEKEESISVNESLYEKLIIFPETMSAYERSVVHGVADELNGSGLLSMPLYHRSFDVKNVRDDSISRRLFASCLPFTVAPNDETANPCTANDIISQSKYNVLEENSDDNESDCGVSTEKAATSTTDPVSKSKKNKNKSGKKLGDSKDSKSDGELSVIGGKKVHQKTSMATKALHDNDIDEMELLAMTIAENEKQKEYNKYRVEFRGAIPNVERIARSDALQSKIQNAKKERTSTNQSSTKEKKASTKKKKPSRNFGGGILGSS